MNALAQSIANILQDYHRHNGFVFDQQHILRWVNQFDSNDRQFILEEFLHLLNHNVYISEAKARQLLIQLIQRITAKFKFKSVIEFLQHADFLDIQVMGNSQKELLSILDEELQNNYGVSIAQCGANSKTYAVYIDDVIATGGTVFNNLFAWLPLVGQQGTTNLSDVLNSRKTLIVYSFCQHTWAINNLEWRLRCELHDHAIMGKIQYLCDYHIENLPQSRFIGQRLNLTYPIDTQSPKASQFLVGLQKQKNLEFAYRNPNTPRQESFYSNPANRVRFESILLDKGIDILNAAKSLKPNHRPMGCTMPSFATLGTGTIFFTWRNISNTCPVVFWWNIWGSTWYPLFNLQNRGVNRLTLSPNP